jgi:hypothetical protein
MKGLPVNNSYKNKNLAREKKAPIFSRVIRKYKVQLCFLGTCLKNKQKGHRRKAPRVVLRLRMPRW